MMRGTFANIRLRNLLAPGTEGGWTMHSSSKEPMFIFDASMKYKQEGTPLVIIAGKEYGSGSSRDWAAKGPALLGVRAVIAESFERIHRSNLVGMGVLPLQFLEGENYKSLGLTGFESFTIEGIATGLRPQKKMSVKATDANGGTKSFSVLCRIDTPNEVDYYKHGGILQYVLRSLLKSGKSTKASATKRPSKKPKKKRAKVKVKAARKRITKATKSTSKRKAKKSKPVQRKRTASGRRK
jgi:aconitate hydratase